MIKQTQTIRRLSVFDHFVGLVLKGLKNHTHVKKVGEHLRISVWYLLTNLKNSYLLKNC